VAEAPSGRWEVICSLSEGAFTQVSFANSICTSKGGTHVEYIANQIISHVQAVVQRKNKKLVVKPHQIRAHLWLFVNALIVNPAFDSQTKETLNTKAAKFGSTY
jgi:DNA topoisomerase-2